jgi:hypothetical protein
MKDKILAIRIEKETIDRFGSCCNRIGSTMSNEIRKLIYEFIWKKEEDSK